MSPPPCTSLVLTRFRPDRPDGGAALRNCQNIRALARLGPVDVLTIGDAAGGEAAAGVREWAVCAPDATPRGLAAWAPSSAGLRRARHPALDAFHSTAAVRWLRSRLAETAYDLVVIEELSLAPYLEIVRRYPVRVIFDAHNVEADLRTALAARTQPASRWRRRWRARLHARRLRDAEQRAVRGADLVWVCSEVDAAALQRTYQPRGPVTVVPNGVDVAAYRSPDAVPVEADWEDYPLTLAYPGAFSYYPNEDAALCLTKRVLPMLRRMRPDARVCLIGRDPPPALRAMAAQDPQIIVTGAVPSVLPHLAAPCIITLPITLGSGTRLKIVEAFAAGRPVISSRKGAEGIAARDGHELLLRENPIEFAEAALQLWRSPALRTSLVESALRLVHQQYSWDEAARCINVSLEAIRFGRSLSLGTVHASASLPARSAPPRA